jgi:hypothetical protein
MRSILILFASIVFIDVATATAQTLVPTARQPVTIIPLGGRIHVLSNRVDANFNGAQDASDSAAAWSVYDAQTLQQIGSYRFAWESVNAQRPSVDTAARTLYVARGSRISSFNMDTQQIIRDTVAPFSASAVTYIPALRTLLLSRRPDFTNPGTVLAYNTLLGSTIASYPAGPNVQQTLAFTTSRGESGVAILSEGNFGRSNSTVSIVTLNALGAALTSTTANVGDTGNHLLLRGDSVFVTSNGSHQVHILDLNTKSIVRTIPTGTTGSNGPRESVVDGDVLYVTTFSNDVRRFRISTGAPITPLLLPQGKPEGLALSGGRLFVANAFLPNSSFTSSTNVAVFDLRTVGIREQTNTLIAQASILPNPATTDAQCRIRVANAANTAELARASFRLVTPLGVVAHDVDEQLVERVDAFTFAVHIPVAAWNLSSGVYVLQMQTASGMQAIPFVVQR